MSKVNASELKKLYYAIGEVAEMFEVNTSLIRFWEKEFPSIQPKKNKKGNRLFTPKEIEKIDTIYTLVKVQGYTLDGAKKAMKGKPPVASISEESPGAHDAIIERLERLKQQLLRLKN